MKGKSDIKPKDNKKKKPHYKKKQSGIYNKKLTDSKNRSKNKKIDSLIEELVAQAQQAQHAGDPVHTPVAPDLHKDAVVLQDIVEQPAEQSDSTKEAPATPETPTAEAAKETKQPMTPMLKLLMQAGLGGAFVCMGLILLLSTTFLVYTPMKEQNKVLAEERLAARMELSLLISDVFPSMKVDDELGDLLHKALENRKNTLRNEGNAVVKEIGTLSTDEVIAGLLEQVGYTGADFAGIVKDEGQTKTCMEALNGPIGTIDARLEELGVAKLKEDIAVYKGTTTTVTKENENGETVTETVVTGGLVPEIQAKKNELQKKYDDIKAKLDALDAYLHDNQGKITGMYNRLEGTEKTDNVFVKMEAVTAYVKANAEDNVFLQDIDEKLESFPGQSKEEDDILFIMKVEAETGIRMQTVNYGQDYQHVKLSNGMLLCYEVYSIPYYATYPGLKNLIAYFNDNDDFYASVYTLSMQYNPANESIQGNMVILHYYLLEDGAEYVPPVIDEEIIPGIDGIFGDVTDNGKPKGPMSNYTPEDVEGWLNEGMTLEEVRKKLTDEHYPETELLWILKKKYKTDEDIRGFLEEYGDPEVDYTNQMATLGYLQQIFPNTDLGTLLDIYNAKLPEETPKPEEPEDTEDTTDEVPEDTTGGEPQTGKLSDYTVADVEQMLSQGMTLRDVRDKIKQEGYNAIELAWILHEEYTTETEIIVFLMENEEYFNSLEEAKEFFECSFEDLKAIYRS